VVAAGAVVVFVSGAAWPPVWAGTAVVGDGVVAVRVPVCGAVLVGVAGGGVVDEGTLELAVGRVSVGRVSVAAASRAVVRVSIVFGNTLPADCELPPQPATAPLPAATASTVKTAARRGPEMEEVSDITPTGSSYAARMRRGGGAMQPHPARRSAPSGQRSDGEHGEAADRQEVEADPRNSAACRASPPPASRRVERLDDGRCRCFHGPSAVERQRTLSQKAFCTIG
jgi:hypothetical protein